MSTPFALSPDRYRLLIFDWAGTLANYGDELMPGVRETLLALKDRGFQLAIATSMPMDSLKKALKHLGLREWFVHTQTSDMGYPKPSPEMLTEILLQTDTPVANAIMIGDSHYDIMMAKDAGMDSIGVLTGSSNEAVLQEAHATQILPSISELLTLCPAATDGATG